MTSLLVGIRLAVRGSRIRIVVTALALAFTVSFLLAVLGALPARQAKLDRLATRQPLMVGTMAARGQHPTGATVRLSSVYSWWRGNVIAGYQVISAPQGSPVPPGLDRMPAPGELVVSPALAAALRGPHGAELTGRFPGKVVAEIGATGLSGPREYFAWEGVARPTERFASPQQALRFGVARERAGVSPELLAAARLGAIGLLLPVLVLVATATRLSAAARDRRLAAIRLVGGTPGQVGWLIAGEALVVGGLGAVLGLGVFVALRPLAAASVPVRGGVFAGDLLPPTGQLVGVLLLVPVLALVVSLLAMRRLVVDPLGVRRRGRRRSKAGWWRLVPLTIGLGLLGAMWLRHKDLVGPDVVLLLGGGALTVVGLAVVAPAVSRLAGVGLIRLPGVAPRLAGRRLLADPSATARTLTGTVLVVFVGTWLLAWLPVLKVSNGTEERSLSRLLPGSTISLSLGAPLRPASETALRGISGVRQVVAVGQAQLAKPGFVEITQNTPGEDYPTQVAVVRCPDLAALLHRQLACGTASAFHVNTESLRAYGPPPSGRRLVVGGDGKPAGAVTLPASRVTLDLGGDAFALLQSDTVLDPSLLPVLATRAFSSRLFITTDGKPGTTEAVRNALFAQGVYGASTLDEQLAEQDQVVRGYEKAARLGLLLAVLVGGLGLLVATLDALRARRRDLAALAALGVPVAVIRRALLLETAAPLVGCMAVALGAGAFAAAAYLAADTFYRGVGLPWSAWGGVAGVALAVVLAITALTLPLAGAATRPEHLRNE